MCVCVSLYESVCVCVCVCACERKRAVPGGHASDAVAMLWAWQCGCPGTLLTVGLVTHAQDDLGGTVVAGHHVRCHQEPGGGRPRQTKVQNLQRAVRLHHNITGLQVLQGGERERE